MVDVKQLIASTKNKTPGQELQPKEVIATNAQIREHMRQLSEDYKELERLYQKERTKRKVRACVRPCVGRWVEWLLSPAPVRPRCRSLTHPPQTNP